MNEASLIACKTLALCYEAAKDAQDSCNYTAKNSSNSHERHVAETNSERYGKIMEIAIEGLLRVIKEGG